MKRIIFDRGDYWPRWTTFVNVYKSEDGVVYGDAEYARMRKWRLSPAAQTTLVYRIKITPKATK